MSTGTDRGVLLTVGRTDPAELDLAVESYFDKWNRVDRHRRRRSLDAARAPLSPTCGGVDTAPIIRR